SASGPAPCARACGRCATIPAGRTAPTGRPSSWWASRAEPMIAAILRAFGRLAPLLLAWAAIQSSPVSAETPAPRILAVLVGVSDYGDDPLGLGDLSGPRNDAMLMADVLIEQGADPAD